MPNLVCLIIHVITPTIQNAAKQTFCMDIKKNRNSRPIVTSHLGLYCSLISCFEYNSLFSCNIKALRVLMGMGTFKGVRNKSYTTTQCWECMQGLVKPPN